jgi:hypothetical protein
MRSKNEAGRRGIRFPVIVATAALLLLGALGCNDDGNEDENGSDNGEATPSATSAITPAATPGENAAPIEELAAQAAAGVEGVVEYNLKTENVGSHPQGTWKVYKLGPNFREDWSTNDAGFPATTTVIVTPGDSFVCSSAPGTTQCGKDSPEHAISTLPYFIPITEIPDAIVRGIPGVVTTELPPETIAGVEASCFDLDVPGRIGIGGAGHEEIKICFSPEGRLMSLNRRVIFDEPNSPEALLELTALSVGEAKPEDFEPIGPIF